MGDKEADTKPADRRFSWVGERVCSSLKVKDDVYQKLLASEGRYVCGAAVLESLSMLSKLLLLLPGATLKCQCTCRAAVASFLDNVNATTLLIYVDGKDLGAVS